ENESQIVQKNIQEELETKTHENENIKVQLSVIHAEKQTLEQQLHSVIENNKINLENLDAKLNRVKSECEALKQAKDALQSEYENYKTRVHSVLKQQKAKPSTPVANMEADERSQLQQNVLQLKIKLQETSEKLRSLQSDYEDLENENERLTTVHSQLSVDSEKKERFWKDRIEKVSQEYTTNLEQHKETIEHLTVKNETLAKTYKDKIQKMEEEHKSKLEKLRIEIDDLEKERQKQISKDKSRSRESPPLKLNLGGETVHLRSEERQAGEGMENTELEQANVPSQPTTPTSATSFHSVSLETLLSPTKGEELPSLSESEFTQEEVITARREIEHLSEVE
ncbi:GRIP and coiled-coil domain-containing 2-like, partial [Paramuricea clavata]